MRQIIETNDQAQNYLQTVREHYRDGDAAYKGMRSEDQRLIEMVTADEARIVVDGVMTGILAMSGSGVQLPKDYETSVERAGYNWATFRGEYERALSSFGVITERLNRGGYEVPSYAELPEEEKLLVASELLADFLAQNALRFGVDGAGIPGSKRSYVENEEGELRQIVVSIADKDKAKNDKEIDRNMAERGYTSSHSAHTALKMSTKELKELRRDKSTMDPDKFHMATSYLTDALTDLPNQE